MHAKTVKREKIKKIKLDKQHNMKNIFSNKKTKSKA
jgi:hypothetical protein